MEKYQSLMKGISGFFMKNVKVSILVILFFLITGIFSLWTIPKESTPDIKFGVIYINTIYQGANPQDIDSLITNKIDKEVKEIEGINKINSTSSVGLSSIRIELKNGIDVNNTINEIKNKIQNLKLPQDAKDPIVKEASNNGSVLFQMLLYNDTKETSYFDLMQRARSLKNLIEGKYQISKVDIGGNLSSYTSSSNDEDYEIKVLINKEKLQLLGLTISQIANTINSFNQNLPIGNYTIGDLNYDFRFDGELENIESLGNIIIRNDGISKILLKDIATIKAEYKDISKDLLGFYNSGLENYISLVVNKNNGAGIFSSSNLAKKGIESVLKNDSYFSGYKIVYVNDIAESIKTDYKKLGITAIQTIFLVFAMIFIFIGFRESIIVSVIFPLAFLITFMFLKYAGYSLNFLTNFSLILTLGISVDTIIVIVQGATDKMKLGFSRVPAIMMAINDFKAPLISGTLTTLSAFLPMMFLPGIMGKFLSYIPITVFITLVACLFLSLTVISVFFVTLVKGSKNYHRDPKMEETLTEEEIELLKEGRKGKIDISEGKMNFREKIISNLGDFYYKILGKFIKNRFTRILTIFVPVISLIFTFKFLSPQIGFTLFPATDEGIMNIDIEGKLGLTTESMEKYIKPISGILKEYPELKVYYIKVKNNKISVNLQLKDLLERQKLGQRDIFEVEKTLDKEMDYFRSLGFKVSFKAAKIGPPSGNPIGIKLVANSSKDLDTLKKVSVDFENFLHGIDLAKNIGTSSTQTPGQFIFKFKEDKLTSMGLLPSDITRQLYYYIVGISAGSIKSKYEDNDIIVKIKDFDNNLTPADIENITINTKSGPIRVGDIVDYIFKQSIDSITREDGDIVISVNSDFIPGTVPSVVQTKLDKFAKEYKYPEGVSFKEGGENAENSELIIATVSSFFIAVFLIFAILVFQFNSFLQPVIILYSIVLAMLGVNLGLYITGNPYSMTFGIGFLALVGIVVNNAIVLIDKMNSNIAKGIDLRHSILDAGKSRLQPILVTTMTTVFGILPLAMQDNFWAGLGYTIAFGLLVGSAMTLFVIPVLYYSINRRKYK